MSWQVRAGHDHNFIDGRTHVHHIHLFNQVTGGEHNLEILLGCPMCPTCRRPFEQSDLLGLDPASEINKALSILTFNHLALMGHAQRNSVPIRLGPLAEQVPLGHKITIHGDHRMLHTPKATK